MKWLLSLSILMTLNVAQASYMATHCANSTATVRWESGHNANQFTLKNYAEKDLTIPVGNLSVAFSKEVKVKEDNVHRCGFRSSKKVFAALVTITASDSHPGALDFLGDEKKIETEVICTEEFNSRAACP